jgi:cellulose biosynthesis protein BcsQ
MWRGKRGTRLKIIAIYHIKGGVGKTAAAVNLSYLAAASGAKTLLCDLDPQSSATFYFRIKPRFKSGVKGFIKGGENLEKNIKGSNYELLDLLPADFSFRNLDIELENQKHSKQQLHDILNSLHTAYDYIFLDCPPGITITSENVFYAAHYILIPVIPTMLSLRSYLHIRKFFKKELYDPAKILTFFSMTENDKTMHRKIMERMSRHFKGVLRSPIPFLYDVEKMGIYREPLPVFAPHSAAAKAYQNLWEEIKQVTG